MASAPMARTKNGQNQTIIFRALRWFISRSLKVYESITLYLPGFVLSNLKSGRNSPKTGKMIKFV